MRNRASLLLMVGGLIGLAALLAAASFKFLVPLTSGWSPDVVVAHGGMQMALQFRAEPAPAVAGPVTLMARVKDQIGYTTRVDELHFNYRNPDQELAGTVSGVPTGAFGTAGDGIYLATAELPVTGQWEVDIQVIHGPAVLEATFPLEVAEE